MQEYDIVMSGDHAADIPSLMKEINTNTTSSFAAAKSPAQYLRDDDYENHEECDKNATLSIQQNQNQQQAQQNEDFAPVADMCIRLLSVNQHHHPWARSAVVSYVCFLCSILIMPSGV